jgi:GNAT superfamily N-acetyltransferase
VRLSRYDEVGPSKELRSNFDCGEESLNRWLAQQAGQSMASHDAVTYLLLDVEAGRIAGYFCLSAGDVSRHNVPIDLAKRAPQPIPVVRMGRFAIDSRYQGQNLGAELLREALLSAVAASRLIGGRAMLVDAINDGAKRFYERFGFQASPIHPMQLTIDLRTVALSAGLDP